MDNSKKKLTVIQQLVICCTAIILIAILLVAVIVVPIFNKQYKNNVFNSIDSNYNTYLANSEEYDSTKYGIITHPLKYSATYTPIICKTCKSKIIEKLFDTQLANGETQTFVFKSEDEGNIYAKFYGAEDRIICIYTSYAIYDNGMYSSMISSIILCSIIITLLCILVFSIFIIIIAKSIKNVNRFLYNYDNDYYSANYTSRELEELSNNFLNYKQAIIKKDFEKQQLFQNISHELKTPITTIKMYGEGIQDGLYKNNDVTQSAEVIINESNNLLSKVSKIMQINKLSHIETLNKSQVGTEYIDISEVLFEILNSYNDRAPNVTFKCELEHYNYRGTKDIWKNIFENIFDNNIRHGATIIDISVNENYLVIHNNGNKIDEKVLPNIAEPFKRGTGGNYGLGVGIIIKSLDIYKYKLRIENARTGGVTYTISEK